MPAEEFNETVKLAIRNRRGLKYVIQGRRQKFFQGRALGGSRGGLPSHFPISRGGGSTPIFGRFNGQNERIFRPGGGPCPPLPMPAYALK